MSQVDDVDAELRLLHVQYLIVFTKWWLCGTYGIAKCSSNVHFLIHLYTLTERSSSVWSMSPLSSPSRMETAPGFSPCRLAMPHCGRSCLVITQLSNQQLWSTPFCLSRALQRKMSRCTVPDRQVQPALDSRKADSWRSSERKWMTMTLLRTCYLDWSHSRWQFQKVLPAHRNASSGSRVETSAHSKIKKWRLCGTYAHCQLSQQCRLETSADSWQISLYFNWT